MDPLFFKLVRVVNLTARPFHEKVGREHHLTLNEWRVMVVLGGEPGLNATQIADFTGLDKMAVSRALAGLKRHRRVQRLGDPADRRRARLYLTAAGKALHETVGALGRQREAVLFEGVNAGELARLDATLDKLIAAVQRAG
ncbi:DNA-binding MarR family transcriptional regulator [Variovorax sp. OAS795]|uniref:MarR family winged helix-turn-helix transcriptional regulator n=1 Tax=Variovorax sp. OAS795 TaxID=3034231 RepID=UPI0033937908